MTNPLPAPSSCAVDPVTPAANQEPGLFHARLVMGDGKRFAALTGQGTQWVTPAAGCLLQPAVGDLVLVSLAGAQGYVLMVLERAAPETTAELSVPGDLRLSAPDGRLRLDAAQGIELDAGPALHLAARQLSALIHAANVACNSLRVSGDEACSHWNTRTDLSGTRVEIARSTECHTERSVRRIAEHEEVTARSIRHSVEHDWSIHAETADVSARVRVALQAPSVHLG